MKVLERNGFRCYAALLMDLLIVMSLTKLPAALQQWTRKTDCPYIVNPHRRETSRIVNENKSRRVLPFKTLGYPLQLFAYNSDLYNNTPT